MRHVMPFWPSVIFVLFVVRALFFFVFFSYEQRGEGNALPYFLFSYLFAVQRTTSGTDHRVK